MEVVQFVPQLGIALWNLKGMYDQHIENGNEIKELLSFIQDYDQQIPILRERFQEGGGNVMGIATFKNLEKDVMEATNKLERWSRNKSFFQVFNSVERMQKLEKLHFKVMASVQKSLGIANLSMLLDLQSTILESNAELKSLLITSIGSTHGMLPTKVRDEVVEASTSSFGDLKFWEDILAAVDNHNADVSSLEEKSMYEDPITTNLMIDPIVASDGNTYCRWTIIDNSLTTNPFNVDEDLTIVIDNLNFRRGLFETFPEQVQIFRQRRNEYRSYAFSLKEKGLWSDAVLALHYVLQWDKRDVECVEALKQVQGALEEAKEKYLQPCKHDVECVEALEDVQGSLQEAKEKYLQPFVGPSNEPGNGGPTGSSIHEMVVETPIALDEAYKLFPTLSSSKPEVRQRVAYGICQWSNRDVKFQRYIVKRGDALEPIAKILREGSTKAREGAARILFNLSTSPDRRRIIENFETMLALATSLGDKTLQVQQIATDTLNNLFPDALELIVEILEGGGSTEAREEVARIFFNLSKSPEWKNVIGNSRAMLALVTSCGDGSLQFQQIASDTLDNLFPDALELIAKFLKKGSTEARAQATGIFFILSKSPNRKSIIGNSLAMRALVTLFGDETLQFQQIATDTLNNPFPDALELIVKILEEGSTEAREQSARLLFNLSKSPAWKNVIENSRTIRALVTLFVDKTLQFQQIATSTLGYRVPDAS